MFCNFLFGELHIAIAAEHVTNDMQGQDYIHQVLLLLLLADDHNELYLDS